MLQRLREAIEADRDRVQRHEDSVLLKTRPHANWLSIALRIGDLALRSRTARSSVEYHILHV